MTQVERLAAALEVSTDALLAEQRVPDPAQDGRTWWPVGPERADGPRVYRIVLPVEEPVRHQHEGHQWLYVLDGAVRLLVGASDRVLAARRGGHVLHLGAARVTAVDRPAEALVIFRP